ncbi:MAG TPA: hypothetical protein PLG67_03510 [Bacillota bacterium]|jgi:hypothetical protein|nr:hypothetical protein [Bacillota bacterium]HRS21365.1 hypothetical protein [Clostridia bacterium]HRU42841.1 hypothetical protein [Candidatus Diapherotrites archaeon]HQE66345.1 hypothetical protein [Bacillota bacterium]HQI15448.1 hypothetical protein [Bacillota bacterium]
MSIRPVDLQTIIPKLPEVQKAKNAENELEKNNLSINMHKEQQQQDKNTQQIVETKKAQESRINKDGKQNRGQEEQKGEHKDRHHEDNEDSEKKKSSNPLTRIDIRI